jgi:hypothetical protein
MHISTRCGAHTAQHLSGLLPGWQHRGVRDPPTQLPPSLPVDQHLLRRAFYVGHGADVGEDAHSWVVPQGRGLWQRLG